MLRRLSLLLLLLCSAIVAPDTLTVYNMKAWGIWRDPIGNADGFVNVYCDDRHFGTTEVKNNNSTPVWEEMFSYEEAHPGSMLRLRVYDKIGWVDRLLGICVAIIRTGRYEGICSLSKGGNLEFSYSLQLRGSAAGQ